MVNTSKVSSIDGFTNLATIGRLETDNVTALGSAFSIVITGLLGDLARSPLVNFDSLGNQDLMWMNSLLSIFGSQESASNVGLRLDIRSNPQLCLEPSTWWVSQTESYIEYPFTQVCSLCAPVI